MRRNYVCLECDRHLIPVSAPWIDCYHTRDYTLVRHVTSLDLTEPLILDSCTWGLTMGNSSSCKKLVHRRNGCSSCIPKTKTIWGSNPLLFVCPFLQGICGVGGNRVWTHTHFVLCFLVRPLGAPSKSRRSPPAFGHAKSQPKGYEPWSQKRTCFHRTWHFFMRTGDFSTDVKTVPKPPCHPALVDAWQVGLPACE